MKSQQKLLSLLMTLAMVIGMIPAFGVTASAIEKLPYFHLSDDGILSWN